MNNYIVRFWTKQPFQADLGNLDGPMQFVHEDDVVDALTGLLEGGHDGAYNLAGEGYMTLREAAEIAGLPIRRMPAAARTGPSPRTMWRLRVSEAPPGQIEFARWPWVVSNDKLKRTLDWTPRHTSRETFEITMRAHGKIEALPSEPSSAAETASVAEATGTLSIPGPLAQLGERRLDKAEVAGSSPARPTCVDGVERISRADPRVPRSRSGRVRAAALARRGHPCSPLSAVSSRRRRRSPVRPAPRARHRRRRLRCHGAW